MSDWSHAKSSMTVRSPNSMSDARLQGQWNDLDRFQLLHLVWDFVYQISGQLDTRFVLKDVRGAWRDVVGVDLGGGRW